MRTSRAACRTLILLGAFLVPAISAEATAIVVTLPEFSGSRSPFPSDPFPAGAFLFEIPKQEEIISAFISGTFGNSESPSTAPVNVFLDGLTVASCPGSTFDCFSEPGPDPWMFVFSANQFALLSDGAAMLTVVQLAPNLVRLGELTLSVTTQPVPEPGTLGLLAIGVLTLARKKFKSRRASV